MFSEQNPPVSGSLALIIFGSVIIAGFFASLGKEPQFYDFWDNLFYTTVFGFLPASFGTYHYFKGRKKQQILIADMKEYHLIKLASEKQGTLTAIDVAIHLKTSHQNAKAILNQLQNQGVFSIKVHEDGVVVYHLNDFLPERH